MGVPDTAVINMLHDRARQKQREEKEHSDFERLMDRLQEKGFLIEMAGGNCPFQVEANHRDGWSIYFRARGTTVDLWVFDVHQEVDSFPDDELIWRGGFNSWEWPAAGWITPNEADYILSMLLADAMDYVE